MIDPLGLITNGLIGTGRRGLPLEFAVSGQLWLQLEIEDEVFAVLSDVALSVYSVQVGVVTVGNTRYVLIEDIVSILAHTNRVLEARGHTKRLCVTQGRLQEVSAQDGSAFPNSSVKGKIAEIDE